jgi:hypothetical protein
MVTDPDVAGVLAGSALALSLLALAAAVYQRRVSRTRLAESERQWKVRLDELAEELKRTRLPVEAANSRAEAAEKSAQHSAKAAAAGAQSSAQSAQAAMAAADAARGILELGKRAWVHATEFRVSLKTQPNENSTLEISIANLGATPARELKLASNFLVCDETPQAPPLKPRVNNVALGPGVSFSLAHFLRVSPAELTSIATGRKLLLACGRADYRDVFGVARATSWCATYDYNAKAFVPAPEHNSTT